ncbi:IclR family transcriptional regulator [Castellaniella defragrans]|jgi:DNA-binding IclR family transcriptional regulator|uniref:D-galactonate regulator, IclR family n=2 Tax=Castellaniella defragrans TaxID=75697 RepID=W8X0C1_CASD6|nr:IclR family transcriptional regulator [Castellaniella defragrans]KAB0610747.1 IclR family transcriptional regulator [Castellaniella defragrans]MBB6083179.1 DNA-binding IclR family transcriptional regulator [Castellaniella defragrans]CDM25329.1 D-galactonate regulator, IclR family [Castellaniella defragrans 65Phen]
MEKAGLKTTAERPTASQTLVRGLDVIEAVSADGASDITTIAARTGMTYSTAHRIVSALIQRQYLKRVPGKGYRLGSKLLALGFQAYSQVDLTPVAHPFLERLARQTHDTVHLACEELGKVFYLDKIASRRPVEISSRIGGMKPLISTGVGKALLLDGSVRSWGALYDADAQRLGLAMPRDQWLDMMQEYARHGYTYDLGEDEPAIRCVAAPIRDASHRIVAALSVSSTADYMPPERMRELVPVVVATARQISAELGN